MTVTTTSAVSYQTRTFTGGQEAGRAAAGQVRRYIRSHLGEEHPRCDDACLIASELVANALRHTRSGGTQPLYAWFRVRLAWTGDMARIGVEDTGPCGDESIKPHLVHADADSESGRGLMLVDALADRWMAMPGSTFPGSHLVIAVLHAGSR